MRIMILAVAVVWLGWNDTAAASDRRIGDPLARPTPAYSSWAGMPGLGRPLPPTTTRSTQALLQPVVGSVERTSRFRHPFTGRAKYSATAYDPTLGRFQTYRFRR
jgi:hypothetical protein